MADVYVANDKRYETCRTAFDEGITQFDLANNYVPVAGASKPQQITENCRIVQHTEFSEEELSEIDKICGRA